MNLPEGDRLFRITWGKEGKVQLFGVLQIRQVFKLGFIFKFRNFGDFNNHFHQNKFDLWVFGYGELIFNIKRIRKNGDNRGHENYVKNDYPQLHYERGLQAHYLPSLQLGPSTPKTLPK